MKVSLSYVGTTVSYYKVTIHPMVPVLSLIVPEIHTLNGLM